MQDTFIVHVEDSECDLSTPVYDFFFVKSASSCFFLLCDELVKISSWAKLHNDIKLLSLYDGLSIGDDIEMFKLF